MLCFPPYQILEGGSDAVVQLLVTTGSDVLNAAVIGWAEYEGICPVNVDHTAGLRQQVVLGDDGDGPTTKRSLHSANSQDVRRKKKFHP